MNLNFVKTYDSLSEFYLDHKVWEDMRKWHEALGINVPEPVWKPSKKYKKPSFEIE